MSRDDEKPADLPGWVTDFDRPEVVAPREKRTRSRLTQYLANLSRTRPAVLPIAAGVGGMVGVAAIVIAAFARPIEEETGVPGAGPTRGLPSPTLTVPTESAEPSPRSGRESALLPDTCADVYSDEMKSGLADVGLELNSVWTGTRELPAGSEDPQLRGLLIDEPGLECFWLDASGGADSAVLTVIADTSEATIERAMARLTELELTRREEFGGVRFFTETTNPEGERLGESHLFRDSVWFATRWYGTGPFGYTADMSVQILG